ncbi:MAG TPA: hypothetical protein PKE35_13870 [Anaerolineales bacterium]|nr:hypothetical protein [Anaerolineales bacterium]HMV96510.1 hypothetical protein [Anaerolineales bacterium]HMX19964.1 hypothetical protein [Anaerolineales bacterium]HMX75338.1 hypothetical protein [Anaerolineales bacterium]HNA55045.1 hypothetical protein [Anaerolineales bacterium]
MYTVSITRLRVRSIFLMPLFTLHAMRTSSQAQKAEGILGVETRFEKNNVVWTKTIWTEESAMKKYRGSGAHQIAMRILSEMCSEASVTRWQQESTELPTWEEAHRRLLAEGKLSKVKHPSPLQASGKTAPETMQSGFKMPAPPVTQ